MYDEKEFVLPAPGNSITAKDIDRGQLRITVDFEKHFPATGGVLLCTIGSKTFETQYRRRDGRSNTWSIGKDNLRSLHIRAGGRVRVTRTGPREYRLTDEQLV